MTKHRIIQVQKETSCFDPITLSAMDHVKLMNRIDLKFLIKIDHLPEMLKALREDYKILEVEGHRLCDYRTVYFDTPYLQLYNDHRTGRANRYKIRQRQYVQSDLTFTEIKLKNNKGRTNKVRIRKEGGPGILDEESMIFVSKTTPYNPSDLIPVLWVNYTRITLVNKLVQERLTLDLNLSFQNLWKWKKYPGLVIAEVKQDKQLDSPFTRLMKKCLFREGGMSKYCLGIINLYSNVHYNSLKPHLYHLQKVLKNDSIRTTCCH